ncbi:MAG: DCC1-like thiol-disulfide oxidoreductase family protein [Vicinamibacterales bacterium]
MTDSPVQARLLTEAAHLVLYDGVCGLCSSLLGFLLTHDRRGVLAFASLQSRTGKAALFVADQLGWLEFRGRFVE